MKISANRIDLDGLQVLVGFNGKFQRNGDLSNFILVFPLSPELLQ
jgi:hypothetical protein